jgi:GH25 family lysozyme M1 (1,4-beta-N-acetylmuramidase)
MKELVAAIKNRGRAVGIYASGYMWNEILGSKEACPSFTDVPLWYAHYDNNPAFDDWTTSKFGGWAAPTIKQYNGNSRICGIQLDLDYF